MSEPTRPNRSSARIGRPAAIAVALVVLAGGAALAACNPPGASAPAPSFSASQLPALEVPTASVIDVTGACLDPSTFAILNQAQVQGADIPTLLGNNKAALISGLQSYEPPDAATGTWRDQLVADLQANDLTKAATEIQMLTSGQVAIASC